MPKELLKEKLRKVVFIDDEKAFLDMYGAKFQSAGFEVLILSEPVKLFDKITAFNPDIIFLDLVMKNGDGTVILKKIKSAIATKWTPVVMLSNINNEADKAECLKEGASQFLIKSEFTPGQLLDYAKEILKMI